MKDTTIIKLYNKVIIPKDTIIIVPSKPEITLIQPTQNYSLQAWSFLLVILVIGVLFYFKKSTTSIITAYGNDKSISNINTTTKTENQKIKIEEAIPKLNFNDKVGESSLIAETTKTVQDDSIKNNIKKMRNK